MNVDPEEEPSEDVGIELSLLNLSKYSVQASSTDDISSEVRELVSFK